MNINTLPPVPRYPKAATISKEEWDAKAARSKKAESSDSSWLDSKVERWNAWRDRADWAKVDRVASLGPIPIVGVGAGVWAGTSAGLGAGITWGLVGGLAAGALCGFTASLFEPDRGGPDYYEGPLFIV